MNGLLRFATRRPNALALALVGLFVLLALGAPWVAPLAGAEESGGYRITGNPRDSTPHPPGGDTLLGTVPGQIDVYHALVWGSRSAVGFGLGVTLLTAALGIAVGLLSAYAGGPLGGLVMRASDALMSFPVVAAVWLFEQIMISPYEIVELFEFEPTPFQLTAFELKVSPVLLALALFSWMPYARLIHSQVVLLRRAEFVVAAQAIGVGRLRMLLRYLLPNALAPALVLAARDVGGMVVLAAAFTFIGFGDVLPWAALLVAGRSWIVGPAGNPLTFWWVYLPATLALVLFSVGWNLLGDGLNVALNPRTARAASSRELRGS